MSKQALERLVTDAADDPDLQDAASAAGVTAEGLVAFARSRGYEVALADLPAEARQVRGNTVGGVGKADRYGFWGSRSAPRRYKKDRL